MSGMSELEIEIVLSTEGGYSNIPGYRSAESKYGMSQWAYEKALLQGVISIKLGQF